MRKGFWVCVLLVGACALGALEAQAQQCDCYEPQEKQRTCNIGGCQDTITVNACGGYPPNNCLNCDAFGEQRLCCGAAYWSARSTGPCHYSGEGPVGARTRPALLFVRTCSGEWLTMEAAVSN